MSEPTCTVNAPVDCLNGEDPCFGNNIYWKNPIQDYDLEELLQQKSTSTSKPLFLKFDSEKESTVNNCDREWNVCKQKRIVGCFFTPKKYRLVRVGERSLSWYTISNEKKKGERLLDNLTVVQNVYRKNLVYVKANDGTEWLYTFKNETLATNFYKKLNRVKNINAKKTSSKQKPFEIFHKVRSNHIVEYVLGLKTQSDIAVDATDDGFVHVWKPCEGSYVAKRRVDLTNKDTS